MLDGCADACGWFAALAATLSFGSFGVPIKSKTCARVDIDPLVMQSYKTIMCFVTCWLVIFMGETVRFTPWGILSGLFWVPGATCGIYGIKQAGLAVAVGTWSSIIVLTSFCWGILIFHEGVKSVTGACCAAVLLCAGLGGISRFSDPALQHHASKKEVGVESGDANSDDSSCSDNDDDVEKKVTTGKRKRVTSQITSRGPLPGTPIKRSASKGDGSLHKADSADDISSPSSPQSPLEIEKEPLIIQTSQSDADDTAALISKEKDTSSMTLLSLNGRIALTRRQLGILAAVFNGTWGGTNLIPMHYASKEGFGGAGYVISYACGAAFINTLLWVIRYLFHVHQTRGSYREAYDALPSFHIRVMWLPGLLSGTLYSIGNFSSLIAVSVLGQGVGYSFCQMSMLVSGLWGIFYFKEIKGKRTTANWFGSALVALAGILWLSYEHESSVAH